MARELMPELTKEGIYSTTVSRTKLDDGVCAAVEPPINTPLARHKEAYNLLMRPTPLDPVRDALPERIPQFEPHMALSVLALMQHQGKSEEKQLEFLRKFAGDRGLSLEDFIPVLVETLAATPGGPDLSWAFLGPRPDLAQLVADASEEKPTAAE